MVDGAELSTTINATHTDSPIFIDLTTTAIRSQFRNKNYKHKPRVSPALSSDWVNALKLYHPEKSDH